MAAADLFPRSLCPSSDEGEVYYGVTPDPDGTLNLGVYPRERGLADTPTLITHEFAHIIQLSRRFVLNSLPPLANWTAEGQATLAEEVVGHRAGGRGAGQNFGFQVAFNGDDLGSVDWYSDRFVDLVRYFGFESRDTKAPGAPEECSWLERTPANPGPCLGGRDVYGTPWSLLRWVSDHYGPTFPGGEQGLQRAIIDNAGIGYASISELVGVPIRTLLAQWAATLYADDRVPGLDPTLTLPSWNLFDIFDANLVEAGRIRGLLPLERNRATRHGRPGPQRSERPAAGNHAGLHREAALMTRALARHPMLLVLMAASGCSAQGSSRSAEPLPEAQEAEMSGKVFVTGSEPATTVTLVREGGASVSLVGELAPELRRLSGTTLRVRGAPRDDPPAGGLEVRSYEVLEVDGEVPSVGVLEEKEGSLWLVGRETRELTSVPDGLRQQAGAKVWIVGRDAEGRLAVQSYGVIREPPR